MAIGTKRILIFLEQRLMVATVGFVTTKAALFHRLMHDLALEFLAVMTGETEFFRLCFQEIRLVGSMGVVADFAVALFRRLMNVGARQTQLCCIVTSEAERRTIFLEPQHANEPVRFMAGETVFVGEWFVPDTTFEFVELMAVEAIALVGEALTAFDLREGIVGKIGEQNRRHQQ